MVAPLDPLRASTAARAWDDPANQPPGHLGISGFVTDPDDSDSFFAIVQGVGAFETEDGGSSWTPRNKGLRRDWPADYEDVGFCVHKLVRSVRPAAHVPAEPRRHAPLRRRRAVVDGDHRRACRATSASPRPSTRTTRETFYVIPVDGGHGRDDARGQGDRLAHARRRLELAADAEGLPQEDAHLGVLRQGMAIDKHDIPGLYFGTSTGQVFASADEGETWSEIASYLPSISSVDVAIVD